MVKSLCKFRRVELADQFSAISRIVSEPNYICSSCARVASEKGYLCKPSILKRPESASVAEAMTEVLTVELPPQTTPLAPVMFMENERSQVTSKTLAKQLKAVKKMAKKKNKQLKKAAKALKHYDKAVRKVKMGLQLS